ncbi:hypothetical protein RB195_017281 [Necator americanus]|uniref:Aldehyde dehydrogenase domain-containing protein n=1 Tax=Necator americanus TaxID=51031 RepID=A0ABR1C4I7_NECAM
MLRTGLSRAAIQIRAASSIPPPIRNIKPKYTKMFINNEWVDAVSKKTYDTINPVDKSLIAKVAEGDKADVDKAVKVRPLDVLMDFAAKQAHIGNYTNQGQFCCGGTRVFVEGKVYDEFVARSKEVAEKRVLDDPFDLKTEQGPQIICSVWECLISYLDATLEPFLASHAIVHLKKELLKTMSDCTVERYVDIGKKEGARLVTGGKRWGDKGFFYEPNIFANVKDEMKMAQEEIFGPVMSILRFDTMEDLVDIANNTIYGLAAGVVTKDLDKALYVANNIRAGTVWVNCYHVLDATAPFGGYKHSGFGRAMGEYALEEYTQVKTVTIKVKEFITHESHDTKTRIDPENQLPVSDEPGLTHDILVSHTSVRPKACNQVTGSLSWRYRFVGGQRGTAQAEVNQVLTSELAELCREAIKEALKERRAEVLAEAAERSPLPPHLLREDGHVIPKILPSELRRGIMSVTNRTAPGPDRIRPERLNCTHEHSGNALNPECRNARFLNSGMPARPCCYMRGEIHMTSATIDELTPRDCSVREPEQNEGRAEDE